MATQEEIIEAADNLAQLARSYEQFNERAQEILGQVIEIRDRLATEGLSVFQPFDPQIDKNMTTADLVLYIIADNIAHFIKQEDMDSEKRNKIISLKFRLHGFTVPPELIEEKIRYLARQFPKQDWIKAIKGPKEASLHLVGHLVPGHWQRSRTTLQKISSLTKRNIITQEMMNKVESAHITNSGSIEEIAEELKGKTIYAQVRATPQNEH